MKGTPGLSFIYSCISQLPSMANLHIGNKLPNVTCPVSLYRIWLKFSIRFICHRIINTDCFLTQILNTQSLEITKVCAVFFRFSCTTHRSIFFSKPTDNHWTLSALKLCLIRQDQWWRAVVCIWLFCSATVAETKRQTKTRNDSYSWYKMSTITQKLNPFSIVSD